MTSEDDREYLAKFVLPFRRLKDDRVNEEKKISVDKTFTQKEHCKWAVKLLSLLAEQHKSIDIQFVQVHGQFLVALVAIVWEEKKRKEGKPNIMLFTSMAMKISATGFEKCFQDLYQNSFLGGTKENNTDGTVAYVLNATKEEESERYFLYAIDSQRFEDVVAKFTTLKDCVNFVNGCDRLENDFQYKVEHRGYKICSGFCVFDAINMKKVADFLPKSLYYVEEEKIKVYEIT